MLPGVGATAAMRPQVSDHGEESYRGSGRLEGRKAIGLPGDITDEAWNRALAGKAVAGLGGLDILVVNAGRQQYRETIDQVSTEDLDRTFKTNLYAPHWITQAALPHLPADASIITTASIQAYEPSEILLDYATTKAGIVAYTKASPSRSSERGSAPMRSPPDRSGRRCSRAAASPASGCATSARTAISVGPDNPSKSRPSMSCWPRRKAASSTARSSA